MTAETIGAHFQLPKSFHVFSFSCRFLLPPGLPLIALMIDVWHDDPAFGEAGGKGQSENAKIMKPESEVSSVRTSRHAQLG